MLINSPFWYFDWVDFVASNFLFFKKRLMSALPCSFWQGYIVFYLCTLHLNSIFVVIVVQSLSYVWLFATPWTAALQASLSFTISQSLSIESVMLSIAQMVKNPFAMQKTRVWSLGSEDPLEKEMATHSGILAWRIPWTEEPGWLKSMIYKELDVTEWLSTHVSVSNWVKKISWLGIGFFKLYFISFRIL